MNVTKRMGFLAGAGALTLSGVSLAATPGTQGEDPLQAQVAALQAEVAQLRAQQQGGDNWLTEQRATEIRGIVQDVLADADTRASLLQNQMGAGWDNDRGFYINSSDGNFQLNIVGLVQARYLWNMQEESPDDDNRAGFEMPHTRIGFWGHVVNPQWQYNILGEFDRNGGSFGLLDALIRYDYNNGWAVTIGQFKAPFSREELVDDPYQLAVERSLISETFTIGRVQGLAVSYETENFRATGTFSDGMRTLNTPALMKDTEFALTGRAEFLAGGSWDQFKDFTSFQNGENGDMGILIGGGVHYQKDEYGDVVPNELEILNLTADASLEFGGAHAFGAFHYVDLDNDAGIDGNPFGFVVQGGVFFTPEWEVFGRFEWMDADVEDVEDLSILTVGLTRYFSEHRAKWTTDVGYAFDEVDAGLGALGTFSVDPEVTGWRFDSDGEDGQLVLRTQVQLMF